MLRDRVAIDLAALRRKVEGENLTAKTQRYTGPVVNSGLYDGQRRADGKDDGNFKFQI